MADDNLELDYKYIGNFVRPIDCFEMSMTVDGCCGQCAIAAILDISVIDVFRKWGVSPDNFRHYTSQKEMKEILSRFKYAAVQRSPGKDKIKIPDCDLAILRVAFGDRNAFWMTIAQNSHYIGLKRMPDGSRYIFDNIKQFDNQKTDGLWIEFSEYYKVMAAEKMFITSYLELRRID